MPAASVAASAILEHAASEQIRDADQDGAHQVALPNAPAPRMIAEQPDAECDEHLGHRRMRIEEAFAMQILARLPDEMDLVEHDVGWAYRYARNAWRSR